MKVALALEKSHLPRTYFYQAFLDYVSASPRFVRDISDPLNTVTFPQEETAPYFNWPHYHDKTSVFVRGQWGQANMKEDWSEYLARFLKVPGRKCILNMQKFNRFSLEAAGFKDVYVADLNLRTADRWLNPRTISMPALPLNVGTPGPHDKKWLASFKGARTHPCRDALARLHNGKDIYCEVSDDAPYMQTIDQATQDAFYSDLMKSSVFAFIPRGDALFSYRLLEAMSYGCIPVIFADDWVLPFDRSINWPDLSLNISEASIPNVVNILRAAPAPAIRFMQRKVAETYRQFFASPQIIFEQLFIELEALLPFCDPPRA